MSEKEVLPHRLRQLWKECQELGIGEGQPPRRAAQVIEFEPEGSQGRSFYRYFIESLFTGLYTNDHPFALRAYVQAHGYLTALDAIRPEECYKPTMWHRDLVRTLRARVEDCFIHNKGLAIID